MRRRAKTLLETLAVISIIVILLVILSPVLVRVKDSAKIAKSKSNLRQIHLQTRLYQSDWDAQEYGNAYEMGLPPSPAYIRLDSLSRLVPPNAPSTSSPILGRLYWVFYNDPGKDGMVPSWQDYTTRNMGNSIMYIDPFNNPNVPLDRGSFISRKIIGITVDGSISQRISPGDWMIRSWWEHQ